VVREALLGRRVRHLLAAGRRVTLREKQSAFARCLAQLIVWSFERGYEFTLADGSIDPLRKVRLPNGEVVHGCRDLVHKEAGLHYLRLAQDLNLFIGGEFIADGGHPAWADIGTRWERMDTLAAWGGRFNDANHFSFRHEGRA
jgi:hypothetical protein